MNDPDRRRARRHQGLIKDETERWGDVIRAAKLRVE